MQAFKCDLCKKYIDGTHPYQIYIENRLVDPRDGETRYSMWLCEECGSKLWNEAKNKS